MSKEEINKYLKLDGKELRNEGVSSMLISVCLTAQKILLEKEKDKQQEGQKEEESR